MYVWSLLAEQAPKLAILKVSHLTRHRGRRSRSKQQQVIRPEAHDLIRRQEFAADEIDARGCACTLRLQFRLPDCHTDLIVDGYRRARAVLLNVVKNPISVLDRENGPLSFTHHRRTPAPKLPHGDEQNAPQRRHLELPAEYRPSPP